MKVFYGKTNKVRAIAAVLGFAASSYAIYWLGRSAYMQDLADIVIEHGEVVVTFHDSGTGKDTPIYMKKES